MNITGNSTNDAEIADVIYALKDNIFRNLNVAEMGVIQSINNVYAMCYIPSEDMTISCYIPENMELEVDDLVLILFLNKDFRNNIKVSNNKMKKINNNVYHSKEFGIIILKLKGDN